LAEWISHGDPPRASARVFTVLINQSGCFHAAQCLSVHKKNPTCKKIFQSIFSSRSAQPKGTFIGYICIIGPPKTLSDRLGTAYGFPDTPINRAECANFTRTLFNTAKKLIHFSVWQYASLCGKGVFFVLSEKHHILRIFSMVNARYEGQHQSNEWVIILLWALNHGNRHHTCR
jgi:hypothetical protein